MKRRLRVVVVVVVLLVVGGVALHPFLWTPIDRVAAAEVPLLAPLRTATEHDSIVTTIDHPYVIELEAAGGRVVVVGVRHTADPADPQLVRIAHEFERLRPDRVLVEGTLGWHVGDRESAIRRFGETAAAAALARTEGVPLASLEPPFAAEVADACSEFGAPRTLAFYFLRVLIGDRDRDGLDGAALDAAAERLLAKRGAATGLGDAAPTLAAFEQFWSDEFPAGPDWRELPAEALWRNREGTWLNRIAERINAFRDVHAIRVLIRALRAGERVLAVTGASHAVIQEPALRAAAAATR